MHGNLFAMHGGSVTQHAAILQFFRERNGSATLGEILQNSWGYEARARFTELRKQGYTITCKKNKVPSLNEYTLIEKTNYEYDSQGGLLFKGAA